MRPSKRTCDQLREIQFIKDYTNQAEGSVLVKFGNTQVLCTASVEKGVPRFLKGSGKGWITAEYGMLPRATNERVAREATRGKQSGRTMEIQRLIGRSLRGAVDLTKLGDHTITIDCDVLQADGGTRTASITGGCVALVMALGWMKKKQWIKELPLKYLVASVSVGIYKDIPVLDLDYLEDSNAQTDMNIVMNELEQFIEIQGTAEEKPFTQTESVAMMTLAHQGINKLIAYQKQILVEVLTG